MRPAAASLRQRSFLIDGEVAVADAQGFASFDLLCDRGLEQASSVMMGTLVALARYRAGLLGSWTGLSDPRTTARISLAENCIEQPALQIVDDAGPLFQTTAAR